MDRGGARLCGLLLALEVGLLLGMECVLAVWADGSRRRAGYVLLALSFLAAALARTLAVRGEGNVEAASALSNSCRKPSDTPQDIGKRQSRYYMYL